MAKLEKSKDISKPSPVQYKKSAQYVYDGERGSIKNFSA